MTNASALIRTNRRRVASFLVGGFMALCLGLVASQPAGSDSDESARTRPVPKVAITRDGKGGTWR